MNFGNPNQAKPDTNNMNSSKNSSNQYINNFYRNSNSYLLQSQLNERQAINLNGGILNNTNHRLYSYNSNQSSSLQTSNIKSEEEEVQYLDRASRYEQQNLIPIQPQKIQNSSKPNSELINITINNSSSNSSNGDQKFFNPNQYQQKPVEQQRQRFLNSFNSNLVQRPFFNFVPNNANNIQRPPFVNIYSNPNRIQQQTPMINQAPNVSLNDTQKQPIFSNVYSSNSLQRIPNLNVQQPLSNHKQHPKQKATKDCEKNEEKDSDYIIELSSENSEKEDQIQRQQNSEQRLTEEQFNADSSEQEEEEKIVDNHLNESNEEDELERQRKLKPKRKRKRVTVIKKRRKNRFDYESNESDTDHSSTSDFFYDASDTLQSKLLLYQQYCSQQTATDNLKENENQNENENENKNEIENEIESEHFVENNEEEEEEGKYSGDYDGILVYIYTGQHNTNENFTFRQLCKHYGLTAWEELNSYLPWRSRSDLRLTLMKMIKKQAISEYSGIRADPTKIGADNTDLNDENYKLKGGLWVNKKWDKSPEEKKEIRLKNKGKYHIDTIEALDVDVPLILSHDYLIERVQGRKANLILFNEALSNEYLKRTGVKLPCSAGLSQLRVMPNKVCKVHKPKIVLKSSNDISKYVFDVPEFKDK